MLTELIEKDERAFASRSQDVWRAVAVHIGRYYLGAEARIVIDQMRDKLHLATRFSSQLEPVQNGWRINLALFRNISVRPPAFAGDNVLQPVSVHVGE